MITVASLKAQFTADTSDLERGANRAQSVLEGVSGSFSSVGAGAVAMGSLIASGVTAGLGALSGLAGEALNAVASHERLTMSLESMVAREMVASGAAANLGAAMGQAGGRAQELIGWVQQLAVQSPFSQEEVAGAFRMAMAFGFTSEQAQRLTAAQLDFAAANGVSGATMERVALAMGQIQARGALMGGELLQLSQAGIGMGQVFDRLSQMTGKSTQELQKMQRDGLIPAGQAIEAITQIMEQNAGAGARQANTFSGLIASLGDLKEVALRALSGGTFAALKNPLADLVNALQDPHVLGQIKAAGDRIGAAVQTAIDTVKSALSGFQAIATGFSLGGVGGGVTALLDALGISPDVAAVAGDVVGQIASAIQSGIATIQAVLQSAAPYFSLLASAIATALPYAVMFAQVVGGVLAGALTVVGGVLQFVTANWQIFANILTVVAAVLAGGAIVAGISALVSGFGLLMGALQGALMLLPMIPGAIVALLGPIGLVIAGVTVLAMAWTQNWGNIQQVVFEVVARAIATINQLGGAMGAIGIGIQTALTEGPWAGAQAFNAAMGQVNADYETAVANAGAKGAEMRANTAANWDAMVSDVQAKVAGMFSAQDAGLSAMVANAQQRAAEIRLALAGIQGLSLQGVSDKFTDAQMTAGMEADITRAEARGMSLNRRVQQMAQQQAQAAAPRATFTGGGVPPAAQTLGKIGTGHAAVGKAATGAAKAAKSAEDKVREAAQAIATVAETVSKLKEFLEGGEFEKLQAGEGADQIVQVAANLAALGRRIYEAFVSAAQGLGDEVNKAAQTLAQGIQSSSQALSSLTGMLPKLWEFIQSPEWGAMQGSMDMVLGVASTLIVWGRALFDVMAAASDGVTEESAKAAQALAQGIGASAQAVSSVIGLLPKLWEFVTSGNFDAIMDSRAELLAAGAKLIEWGKALFEIFAAAAAGVSEDSVKAAQLLSQGIGSSTQALTSIIDLIPKLLNSVWGIDTSFAYTAEGRAVILAASQKLISLGVAIFEAFARAGADIDAKSVAAAGLLSDGITKSVDALLRLTEYVEKAINLFYNIGTRQVVSATDHGEQAVEHISLKLIEIGVNILNNFGIAAGDVRRNATSAAQLMGAGIGQAVDALTKMADFIEKAIATFYNISTRQVVSATQNGERAVQHIALKLIQMGVNILNNFAQAATGVKRNALVAAQQLGTAMGQAVDGLLKMMEFASRAIQMMYDQGTRQIVSATERGELAVQHIAWKLIQMAVNILNNFQAAANTLHYAAPTAAQVMGAAVGQAMDALLKILDLIEKFATLTANVVTQADVLNPDNVTAAAGRLAYFGAAVVNLLWAASETLHYAAPTQVGVISPAIVQTFEALGKVLDFVSQYATFVSDEARVAAVAAGLASGALASLGANLTLLAAAVVTSMGHAAETLDNAGLGAIEDFSKAAGDTFSALGATMDYVTRLIEFLGDQLAILMVDGPGARQWVINFSTNMILLVTGIVTAFEGLIPELTDLQATLTGRFTSVAGDVLDALGSAMEYVAAIPEFLANASNITLVGGPGGRAWTAQFSGWLTETLTGVIAAFQDAYAVLTDADKTSLERFAAVGDSVLGSLTGVMDFVERLSDFLHNTAALNILANPAGTGVVALIGSLTAFAKMVISETLAALGEWTVVAAGLTTFRAQIDEAFGALTTIVDALDTLTGQFDVPLMLTGSDPASAVIRGLVLWAGSVANVAAQAVDELDLLDASGLEPLGTAIGQTVDVFGGALDALSALAGLNAADIPLFGSDFSDPLYTLIWRLVTYANLVATTAAQAAVGFERVNIAGLEPLASAIGDTVGVFAGTLDVLATLTDLDAADIPIFGNSMQDPTYRLIWRLVTYASLVASTAAQAAIGFERVNIEGLSPLASAIGDFVGIMGSVVDAMAGLADLEAPPLPDPAVLGKVEAIVQWARTVAAQAGELAAGFALGEGYGLGDLSTAIGDFVSIMGSVVDALAGLADIKAPPAAPDAALLTKVEAIVQWARDVARTAIDALGVFALDEETYGLGNLSTAIGDFLSILGSVVDALASLKDVKAPEAPSADLLNTVKAIVKWAQKVADEAMRAVGVFALNDETYGLGNLATAIGDFLSILGSVTDALAALKEAPTPAPPSAALLEQIKALAGWAQSVADTAMRAVGAFVLGETYGLGNLSTAIGDFASLLDTVLGLIPQLTTRVDIPNLGDPLSPKSLAGYIGRLAEWAQAVAEVARDAARDFSIADDSGLSQLAGAIGDTLTLLEGGLKLDELESAILNFTGLNRQTVGPKIALLVEDIKWIAQQFIAAAQNSGISEDMADAAARLAQVFGDAVGAFTSALELGTKLADPETVIPTVAQAKDDLDTLMGLMRDIVARFAAEAARTNVDVDKVGVFAETVTKLFESLQTALETVKSFEGIYTGWNGDAGSSGVNNIRSFLAQLFGVFGDFAGQGEAVNQVTAAIASMLGGLANLSTAQGTAAGTNWASAFVAAVQAGLAAFTPEVNAPTVKGGGGGTGGNVYNDYRKMTTVNAPMTISGPAAGQQAAQSIYSLQSLYG